MKENLGKKKVNEKVDSTSRQSKSKNPFKRIVNIFSSGSEKTKQEHKVKQKILPVDNTISTYSDEGDSDSTITRDTYREAKKKKHKNSAHNSNPKSGRSKRSTDKTTSSKHDKTNSSKHETASSGINESEIAVTRNTLRKDKTKNHRERDNQEAPKERKRYGDNPESNLKNSSRYNNTIIQQSIASSVCYYCQHPSQCSGNSSRSYSSSIKVSTVSTSSTTKTSTTTVTSEDDGFCNCRYCECGYRVNSYYSVTQ